MVIVIGNQHGITRVQNLDEAVWAKTFCKSISPTIFPSAMNRALKPFGMDTDLGEEKL